MKRFSFILLLLLCVANAAWAQDCKLGRITSRPFYLGTTRWPPAATLAGLAATDKFIASNNDLVNLQFDNGVPWQAALDGTDFPESWTGDFTAKTGKIVLLSITPINFERTGLATDWGTRSGEALPSEWARRELNDPLVMTAFANYALRAVDAAKPKYLLLAIEANILESKNPPLWSKFVELYKHAYSAVKKKYPRLPIAFSIDSLTLKGLGNGANRKTQLAKIHALRNYLDFIPLSLYPHFFPNPASPLSKRFFADFESFKKPVAVSETGAPSKAFTIFGTPIKASPASQRRWIKFLLNYAHKKRFLFVVNWAPLDFEALRLTFPAPLDELAKAWVYTGLRDDNLKAKPALKEWRACLKVPFRKSL